MSAGTSCGTHADEAAAKVPGASGGAVDSALRWSADALRRRNTVSFSLNDQRRDVFILVNRNREPAMRSLPL